MFDFYKIKTKLNMNDKATAKAVSKAMAAVKDLSKVNNSLVTMEADAASKADKYIDIKHSVNEKIATNKAMISALKQVAGK